MAINPTAEVRVSTTVDRPSLRRTEKQITQALNKVETMASRGGLLSKSYTQPLGKITGAVGEFEKSLEASNARVIAFGASAAIIYNVGRALEFTARAAIDLEHKLAEVNVILNASSSGLKQFGDELFSIAKITGQTFDGVSQAALEFARQGLNMQETLQRTRDAMILVRLAGLDVQSSVESITATINSFNQTIISSTQLVNKLANVDAAFAVSSADLAKAISRVGSSAQDAGVSLDELIAMTTTAQQVTARGGAVIGNSLKTIFTRIQRPAVIANLEAFGMAVRDSSGATKPAIEVLKEFAGAYDNLTPQQRAVTAEMVGGVFQVNVLKAAIGDLGKRFSIYDRALGTSVSSTDEAIQRNAALNKTLKTLMNETMVNLLDMGAKLGSITLSPAIASVLESVNSAIDKLRDNAEADTIGIKMGKGILDGIGSILKGPGMMVLGALVGKLLFSFMKFSTDAVKTFAGMNEGARRQAEMQMLIQNILLKNPGLIDAAATSEQNLARVSEKILEVIRQRNFALAQSEKLSSNIARNLGAADLKAMNVMMGGGDTGMTEGAWRPVNMARGFVPNFSNRKERHAREVAGAISGGYKPGRIKEMTVPSFGRVTYNDAETVKKFPNFKQPAIMPPEKSDAGGAYKKKFQNKHGFDPYNAAAGFIPNFSKVTDLAAISKYGTKDAWKNLSQEQKDAAVSEWLKSSTSSLQAEGSTITSWRKNTAKQLGTNIAQGAPTNWVNQYPEKGALSFDPKAFPRSHRAAADFVETLKIEQANNRLKNVDAGNKFEDDLMTYFGIGVGTKGARNIPFDFIGPSTIPNTPEATELKKDIGMNPSTDIGDAHVGTGHDESLWISKFLRYNEMQSGSLGSAATIAEAFYPSGPDGKWDPKKKGIPVMDVAKQTGDGATYTDVLGDGVDGTVKGSSTLWGVARDDWAGLKKELENRGVDKNQIMHDRKKFVLNWVHDDIDKAKLEEALSFGGMIPNFATKILDRDQLAQYLGGAGVDAAFQSIVKQATQRGQLAETIVGTAGAGKTTLAIQKAGGKNFVTNAKDLSPDDQLIVVRAAKTVVDSPEFTQAGKITYLKGAKDVINQMRDQRSKQIREGTSETGFGRDPSMKFGSTSGVLTEALLAESYAGKLSVYERQADMSLKKAKEFEKLHELKGATATIGAFAPFTSGHQSMSEQADVDVAFVSKGANRQYDVGLSAKEKAKLIEMANPNIMAVPGSAGIQEHFEHGGKAYRMKKADTKVALGADRVAGGEEDLTKSFSAFKGVTAVEGRLDGVSGTKIRKAIVDGNVGILDANLPPQVSSVIKKNLPVLQKRAAFIQDRKDKAAAAMTKLTSEEDAFKAKYGKAKRKGELAEITQARAEFREKKKILKKRMSGYGGRAWDRLGLQMNFASQGFVPSFAYKGMHQKDFGTTMVGRKGAMGTNLSDEQVQKMTAGMRMIRGPEGETLVVGTDMKGRSGRMIATGLTARKIKKSGPHWRTMLNEVPHLFDGLAYDLVGGVAGADWDPEGTSGAMGGIKFEDEFAAAHGLPKAGAKKGSDFRVAETIAKKLGTQKNIQAKVSLHERSKRDKTKVVDIASGFSKYLVDILSHNIKTYGLSSVTTPDRFQQAMEVLNQNPATKKDWVKYFGPMGTKSMGLIPNFFGPKGNKKKSWKGTAQRTKKHSPTGSTFFMTPGKSKGRGKKKTGVRKPGIRKGKKGLHKAFGMIPNFAYMAESMPNFAARDVIRGTQLRHMTGHAGGTGVLGDDYYKNIDSFEGLLSALRQNTMSNKPGFMSTAPDTKEGRLLASDFAFNTENTYAQRAAKQGQQTGVFKFQAQHVIDRPFLERYKKLVMGKFGIDEAAAEKHVVQEIMKSAGLEAEGAEDRFVKRKWSKDSGKLESRYDTKRYGKAIGFDYKQLGVGHSGEDARGGEIGIMAFSRHAKGLQGTRIRSQGLVPNLAQDALKDAIGREMAAGYDKKQVKVGYDSRLKQSDGVGVYNSTEGSLTNAINMHLSSGKTITDLQTQGAHRGHIPNFVDSMDAGIGLMSMGMLASSMGGLKDAVGALKGGFEASEEQIKAFDAAIAEAEATQSDAAAIFAEEQEKATAALQNEQRARDELAAGESKRDELKGQVSELGGKRQRANEMMSSFGRKQHESVAQANVIREQMTAVESKDFSTEAREGLALKGGYMSGMEMMGAAAAGDEKAKELLAQQDQKQKELKAAELEELEKQLKAQKEKTDALKAQRDRANELESRFREQEQQAEENLKAQRRKNEELGKEFTGNKKSAKAAQEQADAAGDLLKESEQATKDAKDAKNKTKKGLGSRAMDFIDKGGASAIMMGAPMIGGMIKQGMDEEDLQGKAKVEGVTTGLSTVATTAQMGAAAGAPGIAIAGTIGLAMAMRDYSNNLKKAKIQEKMADVGKQAETLGEKLNAVTAGGQGYMEGLDKLNSMMKDTSGSVTAEELAKVRNKMARALGDVPVEFQARFRAAAGDAEKIKEIFGEITEELSKAKADLEGAKTGFALQEKYGAGTFSFFGGTDNELFERKATGGLTTEAKRIEGEFKLALRNGINQKAMQEAVDKGTNVDFSKLENMQKFAGENFAVMLESFAGPDGIKATDMTHIGGMFKEVFDRLKEGKKTTELAARDLAKKNYQDAIATKQQKALSEEMRNFNLIIGKVVSGLQKRLQTIVQLDSNLKKFSIDLAREELKGARGVADPFLTKRGKVMVDLVDKKFEIQSNSLSDFRKSVNEASRKSLETITKKFIDANEKVVGQAASLTAKSGKEQLGELARNRKAQQAMIPVIEKAFETWAANADDFQALESVSREMADILKKNGISENAAEGAAKVVLQEIKENGKEAVNQLAKSIQQRNQQLILAERQAYWQRKAVELQERINRFGGAGEIFGDAGVAGLSKSFDGLSKVLEAQIQGATSGNVIDAGRADAMLLEQLLNKMNFDSLRDNLDALAPMLSSAIAGRTADIQRQVAFAQRLTSISNPELSLPSVDAEGIAIDQIASQLKLNQLPDDVAALRRNSEILNTLVSLQTTKLVNKNEEAFDKALKLNGIPQNMKATALGIQDTTRATNNVGNTVSLSGQDVVGQVINLGELNSVGFSGLLGTSIELQKIAQNLPASFVKGNATVLGNVMANVQKALTDSIGKINTTFDVTVTQLRDPIKELDNRIQQQSIVNEGNVLRDVAQKSVFTPEQMAELERLEKEKANFANESFSNKKIRTYGFGDGDAASGDFVPSIGRTIKRQDTSFSAGVRQALTQKGGRLAPGQSGSAQMYTAKELAEAGDTEFSYRDMSASQFVRAQLERANEFAAGPSKINSILDAMERGLYTSRAEGGFGLPQDSARAFREAAKLASHEGAGAGPLPDRFTTADIDKLMPQFTKLLAKLDEGREFDKQSRITELENLKSSSQKAGDELLKFAERVADQNIILEEKYMLDGEEVSKGTEGAVLVQAFRAISRKELEEKRKSELAQAQMGNATRQFQKLGLIDTNSEKIIELQKFIVANRESLRAPNNPATTALVKSRGLEEIVGKEVFTKMNEGKIGGNEANWEAAIAAHITALKNQDKETIKNFQSGGMERFRREGTARLNQLETIRDLSQQVGLLKEKIKQTQNPEERTALIVQHAETVSNLNRARGRGVMPTGNAPFNETSLQKELENLRKALAALPPKIADAAATPEQADANAQAKKEKEETDLKNLQAKLQKLALEGKVKGPGKTGESLESILKVADGGSQNERVKAAVEAAKKILKQKGVAESDNKALAKEIANQLGLVLQRVGGDREHTSVDPTTAGVADVGRRAFATVASERDLSKVQVQPQAYHEAINNYIGMGLEALKDEEKILNDQAKSAADDRKKLADRAAKAAKERTDYEKAGGIEGGLDPTLNAELNAREKQIQQDAEGIKAREEIIAAGKKALAQAKQFSDQEKQRTALMERLNLKNIQINQTMFEQVGMTAKLQKLLEAFGDLQRDMAKDELNQAIAKTRKSQFLGGRSTSILGSGISETLMGQVGRTDFKRRIAESRSGTLEEIKRRRTARLRGADFSGLLSGASRRISEGTTETQVDSYGMGDAGTVFEFDEKAKATMDALKKYGLEQGMSPEKMKEWAVKNQDRLMQIFNDPALQIDDAQVKHLRELFNVMSEGEALFIGLKQTMDENNMTYNHQLDLYRKGLITFEELNGSFQSLEKAAVAAGEFIDADKLTAQMRATAQNAADTFARTLHRAMNDAASGDEVKKATDDLVEQYITNPAGFRPATPEEQQRRLNRNAEEAAQIDTNAMRNLPEGVKLTDKDLADFQKNNPKAFDSSGNFLTGDDADTKRLRKFATRRQKQRKLRDEKEAEQPKTIAEMQEGLARAAARYNDELHRSHEMYDAGLAPIGRAQAAFNKLTELHKAGQSGLDAAMFEEQRVKMLQQTAKDYDRSLQLTSEGLRAGTVAASDGVAAVDQWTQHIVKYGQATMTAEQRASKIAELRKAQGESAAKFNDEFEMTKELFDANVLSTQDLAAALDATNEAAIRAGNYGFKEFSNSLRMGFTYTTQDFAKDIDSMGREFGQDFKSGVSGAFSEAIKGTKNLKEAFADAFAAMADKMLDKSLDIGVSALMSPLGFNKGGIVKGYSSGGSVTGGSGTKDDVPAYLTKGEYVIKKSSVQAYGKDFFDSLNKGSVVQANRGGAISRLVKQQTEKQRELDAAGIRQFSYKWADPEKTKEDWLGRDTGQAVMNTSSDFRVNMGTTLTPERIDAIQAVAEKYPDVAKNLDRDLFDQSKLEIGQGNYKVRLNNRFVYDNMKRPDQGMMRTDTRLSAAALTDENNPQNQYKFEKREAFFDYQRERLDYIKEQQEAYEKFEREKEGRRWGFLFGGAALGLGGMLAGGGRRGTYMNFATGGMSPDNVAALLTGGEYVIRKDVVDKHGTQFFDKLNKGELPKFNVGGLVGAPTSRQNGRNDSSPVQRDITSDRTGGATSNTNNISITVNVDSNGNVGAETQENQGEAGNLTEEESKELAGKIKSSVLNVIIEQKRPGGMLYE